MSTLTDVIPFNLQAQDSSDAAIDQAVAYAIQVANVYASWLAPSGFRKPGIATALNQHAVLDLGPGPSLGTAVLMACAGARVSVADRYLIHWDPAFHRPFFLRLLSRLESCGEPYLAPLRQVIESDAFPASVIRMFAESAETLDRTGIMHDVVFSNATLEHVEDMPAAARALFAVTVPGGIGFHQIDFRDHRDFADPLRFLTLEIEEFEAIRNGPQGNFGTRWRLPDFVRSFEEAGFRVRSGMAGHRADAEYLTVIRPSLAAEFRDWSGDELAVLGALICVERPV